MKWQNKGHPLVQTAVLCKYDLKNFYPTKIVETLILTLIPGKSSDFSVENGVGFLLFLDFFLVFVLFRYVFLDLGTHMTKIEF